MMMMPGMRGAVPGVSPFLPGRGIDVLTLAGQPVILYGFNGQQPGLRLRVVVGSTVFIEFTNQTEIATTMRWHGVRVDNRFDGVPGLTQPSVGPGETFLYEVRFDDPGIFWYHPHEHADIAQDLGLYGNIVVDAAGPDHYGPANREEFLILDDIQVDEQGLLP